MGTKRSACGTGARPHLFDEGQKESGPLYSRPPGDSGLVRLGAALSAAETSQAALLVQAGLLALRLEVAAVPELSEDSGPLHRGLEPLQEALPVLTIAECYKRQTDSPCVVFCRDDPDRPDEYNTARHLSSTARAAPDSPPDMVGSCLVCFQGCPGVDQG